MSRRLVPLTLDNLVELPCATCAFWESGSARLRAPEAPADEALAAKESWLSATLLEWGSCGTVAVDDGRVVGYVTYAPAHLVPRMASLPALSSDAVALAGLHVAAEHRGVGFGRLLVQGMARDLTRRGVRAVEAVASSVDTPCLVPAGFLLAVGFKTVRPHPLTPRLRLDLRSVAAWRDELVEAALGRLRVHRPIAAHRSLN